MRTAIAMTTGALLAMAACTNPFGRKYEYEERVYLAVDGSASVTINTSLRALADLRGVTVMDEAPDRDDLRRRLERLGCPVTDVGRPWTRDGRTFVQIELAVDHIRRLPECPVLSWSLYSLEPENDGLRYRQVVGAARRGEPEFSWSGNEIVAFRLHVPSRVNFHNVKRLEDGSDGEVGRGNILSWEQTLADRRKGLPVVLDVHMDAESILNRTLWLFAGSLAAALGTLAAVVWFVRRRGRRLRAATARS